MISFAEHIKEIDEGVNDLALSDNISWGKGSGKTFIVGKTGLTLGFRVVNSDTAFENALEKGS